MFADSVAEAALSVIAVTSGVSFLMAADCVNTTLHNCTGATAYLVLTFTQCVLLVTMTDGLLTRR